FMAVAHLLLAGGILPFNLREPPGGPGMGGESAFCRDPAPPRGLGAGVPHGLQRRLFSHEAGKGPAPHAR
ncbi:sodium:alanine symporter family protein, partial [Pseudomonas aeruginosa]|nr:sodium:alanine symporter family protein [Pseudomonas aeruginosa]